MLQDYRELAINLKAKFETIKKWPEIKFNSEDKAKLLILNGVEEVNDHSIQLRTIDKHIIIPSQYILYSICIKELALDVKQHLDIFNDFRKGKTQEQIGDSIKNNLLVSSNLIDDYSKQIAFEPLTNKLYNFDSKEIVNGNSGTYKVRGTADLFSSIILKIINVPNVSSAILGDIIYNLTENNELYNYLEKRFIDNLPYITKEKKINAFIKNIILFLLQYDDLKEIKKLFLKNNEPSLISIKDGDINLTSIFKISHHLLDDPSLSQGGKLRFFKNPIFYNTDNEFVYLSTEWTDGTDSRLDLNSFQKLIIKYYPEFSFERDTDTYYLKSKSINSINYTKINSIEFKIENFESDLIKTGIQISQKQIIRFVGGLLTKPFIILTGLSGSGKTKLAQAFALWICENENQYRIVAVGADWTNREPLLGFANALESSKYVKPDNGVLDLIIAANTNTDKPYFLILDEMNLSHVERYFADFLSVMESKGNFSLHAGLGDLDNVPAKLKLPSNLFIIGTVNIDETTYMFSPKVLDRASVIEFRVTANEMEAYLKNSATLDLDSIKGLGAGLANRFISISGDKTLTTNKQDEIKNTLLLFFSELKKTGSEFGYRSAAEIVRFAAVIKLIKPEWQINQIMDAAIMQKLLPKVHGARRKLEPVLKALASFCIAEGEDIIKYFHTGVEIDFSNTDAIKYPVSLEKILRMYQGLIQNGFTSYAEA